jgi:hypothetical protein
MKRIIGPEIDRDVKWLTLSPNREGGNALFAKSLLHGEAASGI